jgi:hypothetical protein
MRRIVIDADLSGGRTSGILEQRVSAQHRNMTRLELELELDFPIGAFKRLMRLGQCGPSDGAEKSAYNLCPDVETVHQAPVAEL